MYTIFYITIVALSGLLMGSFLNSVVYRLALPDTSLLQSFFHKKRSYCPQCTHVLSSSDLIPIISFCYLGGRCRYCSQKISWQYPLVEIATAVLFALAGYLALLTDHPLRETLFLCGIISSSIVIFVYDLYYTLIPDVVLWPSIFVTIAYLTIYAPVFFWANALWAGIAFALFFALLHFGSRGTWMGFGDVKLVFWIGCVLGFAHGFVALFLAFVLGAGVGSLLMLLQGKNLKSQMPFAPFLLTGMIMALFWGDILISWYLFLV